MGAGNNRLYYLPARIARFEFIFLIEFKLSSTCRAGVPVRGPLGYARCPARPRTLPGRPRRCVASRPMPTRIVSFSSDFAVYQRIYRMKGLPSRLTEGPFHGSLSSGVPAACSLSVDGMIQNGTSFNHTDSPKIRTSVR